MWRGDFAVTSHQELTKFCIIQKLRQNAKCFFIDGLTELIGRELAQAK